MRTAFYSEQAFLEAWERGVELAGGRFFGLTGTGFIPVVGTTLSKWDLTPSRDAIETALGVLSSGEALFLAALYSFYDSDAGGKMLNRLGVTGLGDVAARLDEPRRRVVADLLVSYVGW